MKSQATSWLNQWAGFYNIESLQTGPKDLQESLKAFVLVSPTNTEAPQFNSFERRDIRGYFVHEFLSMSVSAPSHQG